MYKTVDCGWKQWDYCNRNEMCQPINASDLTFMWFNIELLMRYLVWVFHAYTVTTVLILYNSCNSHKYQKKNFLVRSMFMSMFLFRMSHLVFFGYLVSKLMLLKVSQNIMIPNFKRMETKDEIFQLF